jgi:DNA repair protein RadC
MPNRDDAPEGPRERLLTHGAAALSNAELVALLLRTGARGRAAIDLARQLLDAGGIAALAQAAPGELAAFAGVGPAKAASLLAAFEIGRRLAARPLPRGERIGSPQDVHRHFHARLRDARAEEFHIVLLDARHRVLRSVLTSQGTLTASLVHPREVFRPALREAAAAVVLVHNHPSGDPTPSSEDREITRRLARAGALLGVPVLDHVIVADRGYASLREQGDLAPEAEAVV